MSDAVHLPGPAADLLAIAWRVTAAWLRRSTMAAADRGGFDAETWPELETVIASAAEGVLARLSALLATDVDEQRTNPLSLFRAAVAGPSALLAEHGVPRPPADPFAAEHLAGDPYGLGPATWADIDPELHDPGIAWGAWKAMTVLGRRRDEGRR